LGDSDSELVDCAEEVEEDAASQTKKSNGRAAPSKKPPAKRRAPAKKSVTVAEEGDDDDGDDDAPISPVRARPPPNAPVRPRAARASRAKGAQAAKKPKLDLDIVDPDDEEVDNLIDKHGIPLSVVRRIEARGEKKALGKVTDQVRVKSYKAILNLLGDDNNNNN
jgi:hypothetical protein